MKTDSKHLRMNSLFCVCILLICSAPAARGQSVQTDDIRWAATGFTDLLSNTTVSDAPCQFVTHGSRKIEWIQGNGSYVVELNITGSSGTWSDLSLPGSISFSLNGNGLTGEIIFSRNTDGIKAELSLTGGTADIRNSYTIATIEKL